MQKEIIMIQPRTSLTGTFISMLPLGILYASSKVVKRGYTVHILDTRINPFSWEKDLKRIINSNTIIVSISVMSGISIMESIKISRYIKHYYPDIHIVWGGPHPTFSPDDVFKESSIDFIIRGYGSESFYQLVLNLIGSEENFPISKISGLSWRDNGNIIHNEIENTFEFIDYRDIPYHLIENFFDYRNINANENVFPMYSVMGCPYKCAFCSSPAYYSKMKKKWQPYSVEEIVSHIKMVKERYGATFIYFIDDDSFVDLTHVKRIIDEMRRLKIQIKLGFRGARIDEILKMSDSFLKELATAGTNTIHIGVESGSDRILKLMNKNITVDEIISANLKLARHPEIKVFYNFIVGYPTETIEETKMTRDLILRLIKENSSCNIIPLNKPRPLPGTELYKVAVQYGYVPPRSLEEWGKYDVESSDYNPKWLSNKHNKFIRMMFLCMYFIDNKIFRLLTEKNFRLMFLKILAGLYKPIALFRFKHGFYHLLIEDKIYGIFNRFFQGV